MGFLGALDFFDNEKDNCEWIGPLIKFVIIKIGRDGVCNDASSYELRRVVHFV